MPSIRCARVDISAFGAGVGPVAGRGTRNCPKGWNKRSEDRIEHIDYPRVAADHQAEAPIQPPHTTERSNVDIMNASPGAFPNPPKVVLEEGVDADEHDIARLRDR